MNIYVIDSESSERMRLEAALEGHASHFLAAGEEIPADAELLSVFINTPIEAPFLDAHPSLRLVATRSTTTDHIDLQACADRGVAVAYVPSYGDHMVAEHVFALMLALARRLREALESMHRQRFSYEELRGFELRGKTLGVIGTGRTGGEVLRLGRAFGMTCLAHDIKPHRHVARRLGFRYVPLPELLQSSHVISLHTPATPATRHLLDRKAFALCRKGVVIINTARGALIDTDALIEAMEVGKVGGAGMDVIEDERVMRGGSCQVISSQIVDRLHEGRPAAALPGCENARVDELARLVRNEALLSRSNVIFTPHIAFNSEEAIHRINQCTAKNIKAFLRGKPVNLAMPREMPGHSLEVGPRI